MIIQSVHISDILPYAKNAKKHSDKQISQVARSIERFGFTQPLVIDKNNELIIGHCRLEAAKKLNMQSVPTLKLENLTPPEIKALRLADNKLNESEWDMSLAIPELKELSDDLLDLTGFNKDLLLESDERDDIVPATPTKPQSKLGDLYHLGPHKVLCGDSANPLALLKLMDDHKADMIFTDPPYNVAYTGMQNSKQWEGLENDAMSTEDFQVFLEKALKNMADYSKAEAALYLCHADKTHSQFRNAFESSGFEWRATIIWVKNSPAFNFAQYKYAHEPIFYCFKKGKTVNWYGDLTRSTVWHEEWDSTRIVNWYKAQIKLDKERAKTTVWEAKKEHGDHPTIKPVELIVKAIINSSQLDDLILDAFLGSGSSLIASEKSKRICYGLELSPNYVDVIIQRYVDYTGNEDIIKNGKEIIWPKKALDARQEES